MRDLTKSVVSMGWALSVFGLEQISSLFTEKEEEEGNGESMEEAMDSVTEATGKHFGDRAQSIFDSGDRLQREFVDMMFDSMKAENWSPTRMAEWVADMAERSADAVRDAQSPSKRQCVELPVTIAGRVNHGSRRLEGRFPQESLGRESSPPLCRLLEGKAQPKQTVSAKRALTGSLPS